MLDKQTKKSIRLFRKQADKKIHNWQKQANKLVDQLEPEKKYNAVAQQVEKIPGLVSDFVNQLEAEKKFKEVSKQAEKIPGAVSDFVNQLEPEKKYNAVAHQVEKIPGKVSDFVSQLEPEKKYNAVAQQVEKIPGLVSGFVDQLEPEKKYKEAAKQAEKVSAKVSDFVDHLEPDKKYKEASKQVEKVSGKVSDFVDQLEPDRKLTQVKDQLSKMTEKTMAEGKVAKKSAEDKLSPEAAKQLKEFGEQAVRITGKYEKSPKKKHPIRNTVGLAALGTGLLAWNNQRLWKNAPALESKLEGRGQYFISRWGRVYYKEAGSPENPPIVLVHGVGAGATSYEWRKNFEALSHDFHVYAYDLLGFGKSERSATVSYTAELYIDLLSDFLREVVKRPAGLVAASLAGGHAIQVANRFPELVNALVLLQPAGNNSSAEIAGPNVTGSFSYPILRLPILGQGLFSFVASRFNIRSFMNSQLYYDKKQVTYELVEQYYIAAHQKGAEFAPLAFFAGKLNAEIGTAFGNLRQPVLLIWGRQSKITPLEQAYKLQQQLPGAELKVLEDTKLACNDEKADQFNQLVTEFLSKGSPEIDNRSFLTDISAARG